MVDQRLEILAHRAELRRADVQRLPHDRRVERAHDCVDEILDRQQLVAVRRRRRGSGCAAPRGPSRRGSRRPRAARDRRTSSDGRSPSRALAARTQRTAPPPRSSTRRRRRRRRGGRPRWIGCRSGTPYTAVDETRTTRRTPASARGAEHDRRALDVHRADRGAALLDRQRGGGVNEDVGPRDQGAGVGRQADVASELLDTSLELRVVERREVERPHGVAVGDEAPREMQAEEARAAGDRDEHGAENQRPGVDGRARRARVHRRRRAVHEHRGREEDRRARRRSPRGGSARRPAATRRARVADGRTCGGSHPTQARPGRGRS